MIADRIKYFRSLRRKTQVNLAQEACIDYRHFQKLEAGQSDFKVSTIFKLSQALQIPACHLLQLDPFEALDPKWRSCANNVLAQLEVSLVAIDMKGKLVYCNNNFAKLMGFPTENDVLQNWDINKFIPNQDSVLKINEYSANVREGKIKSDYFRTHLRVPSGDLKQVFVMWNQCTSLKGEVPKGVVAAIWDSKECHDYLLPTSAVSKIG